MLNRIVALVVCTLVGATFTLANTSDAHALGFDANVKLKAGLQLPPSSDEGDTEYDSAFAYGAEAAFLLGFIPALDFKVGPYFSLNSASHSASESDDISYDQTAFAVGGKLRLNMVVVAELHGGYAFGDAKVSVDDVTFGEGSFSGLNIGAFVGYGFPVVPVLLDLEIGPYFDLYSLKGDDAPDDADSESFINFGLAIQGSFGF